MRRLMPTLVSLQLWLLHSRKRYHLFVGAIVLFGLVSYVVISPRRKNEEKELPQQQHELLAKGGPAKEFLDFDYKYDLVSKKSSTSQHNLLEPDVKKKILPSKTFRARAAARDRNNLNGIPMGANLDEFEVVGGVDLFVNSGKDFDEFAIEESKVVAGLGENGAPVHLEGSEAEEADRLMKTEAFNIVASDKISMHRTVPDTRDPRCKELRYDSRLPTASVIIIFTNEAWSPLIRTIWSVLDKSAVANLHEIILVDDYSDKKHLKDKLRRYIQNKFPSKVKLLRLPQRQGLIRARLAGAKLATGDVLLFLDSHCECGPDWLPPLLQRIKDDKRAFVVPIIDVIDDQTMQYYNGNGNYFQIGGFTWSGHFTWIDIPEAEKSRRSSPVDPVRTPTMAGGLFAVDRNYFWDVGSYDEEMDVWGGENLEMSFRVWQCGGLIETLPCSRVGHIFRSFHPYSFPNNKDTHGINTARTVEVWMDEYKRLFYMNRPDLANTNVGNVTNRLNFKVAKGCKPFKWYLDHVYPQKFVLDSPDHVFAYGRVKNEHSGMCVDTLQNDDTDTYDLGVYTCHQYVSSSQFFSFSKHYQLRKEDSCAVVTESSTSGNLQAPSSNVNVKKIRMVPCKSDNSDVNQQWIHTKQGRLIHKATNMCLDAGRGQAMEDLHAETCVVASKSQIWFFDAYHNN